MSAMRSCFIAFVELTSRRRLRTACSPAPAMHAEVSAQAPADARRERAALLEPSRGRASGKVVAVERVCEVADEAARRVLQTCSPSEGEIRSGMSTDRDPGRDRDAHRPAQDPLDEVEP